MKLTFACGQYDRTIPLQDRTVKAEGIELEMIVLPPGEIFRRQARDAEFDVSEFSLATHSLLLARGDTRFVAIPVFPSRMFRHSAIYVRRGGRVRTPADLAGKRVGVQEFQQTAGVWLRGILQDDHGVPADRMTWVFGTYNEPGAWKPRVPIELPARILHEDLAADTSLDAALLDGSIDAIIGAAPPRSFTEGRPEVVRLFSDFRKDELDYYRRTRIFPIMHIVVIKREIVDREPGVVASLYRAFNEALRVGRERVWFNSTLYIATPWLHYHRVEDLKELGEDPYTYGLTDTNRRVIETFERYLCEQGLVGEPPGVDELFAPVPGS